MTGAQKVLRYNAVSTTGEAGSEKVLENRLRRQLQRMGFRLMKSRARDPRDITFAGYQIADEHNSLRVGHGNAGRGYAMTLDDVQEWIRSDDC
jgi:hypothetical protein